MSAPAQPPRPKPRSLTRETLLRVAVGVTLIVTLSSGITYWLLNNQLEQRALERLREYSQQRTQLHEARFALGKAFHEVIKADMVRRYTQGVPNAERRFDALMTRDPDGAWRNRPAFADITRYSTGWIHKATPIDAEFKRRWMLYFDTSEHYSRLVTSRFVNFYLLHPTQMVNMGYDDPVRSGHLQWAKLTPADYPMNKREHFDAAGLIKNPSQQTVWAGPYFEPVYKQILVSALTPVYVGNEQIATIGSDDPLGDLEATILRSDIADASHTVFRKDGRLVVDPRYMRRIVASHNGFSIAESKDVRLETLWKLALPAGDTPVYGYARNIDQFYAISRLRSTGWYFASTLPGQVIRAQAFRAAQWVLWVGIASVCLLIVSLALILRRQIARPLRELEEGIRSAAAGERRAVPVGGDDELGHMAAAFNTMLGKVSEREAEIARQRESLHQREKLAAMGSLLAGVAHELNNPLSIVVGRATMLQEEATDEITRTTADKIRAAAERCARIVKTFLSMARQRKPEQSAVAINSVLTDCLEILSYGLRTAGVTVERQLAPDLPSISGDADQLHQVFLNLIVNAQQAMESQPLPRRLRVVSDRQGDRVRILIADNGPGIAPAIRSRIFDPYFTTKPPGGGTDVGLAVSLGIVESHEGSLTVDCPPEGGAVFQVLLPIPVSGQQPTHQETDAREVAPLKWPRFLIVDDEPEVGMLLADILRREASSIDIAASGQEALEFLGKREYDAILTDLRMPEMDGPELYRQIERRWPQRARQVIFITGDALSPTVQTFLAGTGQPYLEKPFVPADVRGIVREVGDAAAIRPESVAAHS